MFYALYISRWATQQQAQAKEKYDKQNVPLPFYF